MNHRSKPSDKSKRITEAPSEKDSIGDSRRKALRNVLGIRGERLPKVLRIRSKSDFDALFNTGRVLADATLVVHAHRNSLGASRIAISISKRVGNSPTRNRWKRLIREAYRRQRATNFQVSMDILVRPRRGAVPDLDRIERSLRSLFARLAKQLHD